MGIGGYTYCIHKTTNYLSFLFINPKQQTKIKKGLEKFHRKGYK